MAEIKSLTIRHHEIMDYLMANPMIKLGDVAAYFRVTPPWMSQVIHSDVFQAVLKEKQNIAFHHTVLGLADKINAVANLAMDKLLETLPMETETRNLQMVASDALDRLGFSSKTPTIQINNDNRTVAIGVQRSELENARALFGKATQPVLEVKVDGQRAPIGLSDPRESRVGELMPRSASVPPEFIQRVNGGSEERGEV